MNTPSVDLTSIAGKKKCVRTYLREVLGSMNNAYAGRVLLNGDTDQLRVPTERYQTLDEADQD